MSLFFLLLSETRILPSSSLFSKKKIPPRRRSSSEREDFLFSRPPSLPLSFRSHGLSQGLRAQARSSDAKAQQEGGDGDRKGQGEKEGDGENQCRRRSFEEAGGSCFSSGRFRARHDERSSRQAQRPRQGPLRRVSSCGGERERKIEREREKGATTCFFILAAAVCPFLSFSCRFLLTANTAPLDFLIFQNKQAPAPWLLRGAAAR